MNDRSALRRLLAVLVIVAVLVGGGFADRRPRTKRAQQSPPVTDAGTNGTGSGIAVPALSAPDAADVALLGPTASPVDALSTTWYCAGGPSDAAKGGRTSLILANRAGTPSRVQLTVFGVGTATVRKIVSVAASHRLDVPLATLVKSTATGAVVESSGGGVTVAERIATDRGSTSTPCTTRASSQWYFADGSSDRGATLTLTLFNPFPDLVTADVSVVRADGYQQPPALSGVPVPAGSVVTLRISDVQKRQTTLSTLVSTRQGRVVAALTQSYDGTGHPGTDGAAPEGTSVTLGAPRALSSFVLPVGLFTARRGGTGLGTRISIVNPGSVDSTVRLDVTLDDPATNGQPTPITLHIPATSAVQLGANALRQIPAGSKPEVPFTVRGRVLSGGPVSAEVVLDGTDPYSGHGTATMQALAGSATDWIFSGGAPNPVADMLSVVSPDAVASYSVTIIDKGRRIAVGPAATLRVSKGGISWLDLQRLLVGHSGAIVLVHASGPVLVARLQSGAGNKGLSLVAGVPVLAGLRLLG